MMFDEKEYREMFSHVTASAQLHQRILEKSTGRKRTTRKLTLLAAATAIFFLLACGAAFDGSAMLEAVFGENGRKYIAEEFYYIYYDEGPPQPVYAAKGERQKLNMELAAKYIVPHVFEIGKSISDGDCTITAEYGLVDRDTNTGAVYLKIENPPSYQVSNSGKLLWIDGQGKWYPYINCTAIGQEAFIGNLRVAQEETTERILYLTYFFTCEDSCTGMTICADGKPGNSIAIEFPPSTKLSTVKGVDGKIVASPFAMKLSSESFGITFLTGQCISLQYKDSSEYVVSQVNGVQACESVVKNVEEINNTNGYFFLDQENTDLVLFFNRVVDISQVDSVIINGQEYPLK